MSQKRHARRTPGGKGGQFAATDGPVQTKTSTDLSLHHHRDAREEHTALCWSAVQDTAEEWITSPTNENVDRLNEAFGDWILAAADGIQSDDPKECHLKGFLQFRADMEQFMDMDQQHEFPFRTGNEETKRALDQLIKADNPLAKAPLTDFVVEETRLIRYLMNGKVGRIYRFEDVEDTKDFITELLDRKPSVVLRRILDLLDKQD